MTLPSSGIYKITNLNNNKVYIGQSQNIFTRKKQHFTQLRHNKHPNKDMQKDWNINNRGFRWDVIEYCELNKLNEREEYWIKVFNSILCGYNAGWAPYRRKEKNTKQAHKSKKYHKTR